MNQRPGMPQVEAPDLTEKGAASQVINKRLFMQLLVFTGCLDAQALVPAIKASGLEIVLYADAGDPRGVGLLFMGEDPSIFTDQARKLVNSGPFAALTPKNEFTMTGRTYSVGHEQDLEDWLLQKPRRNAFNPALNWHVWYPLRRKGEFEALSKDDQRNILMEHARLGMSYGQADFAHDIRLACHGLDKNDNEFVLGVVAHELHAISKLVQDMRKTQQTSKYIQSMGPFFVGKVLARFSK